MPRNRGTKGQRGSDEDDDDYDYDDETHYDPTDINLTTLKGGGGKGVVGKYKVKETLSAVGVKGNKVGVEKGKERSVSPSRTKSPARTRSPARSKSPARQAAPVKSPRLKEVSPATSPAVITETKQSAFDDDDSESVPSTSPGSAVTPGSTDFKGVKKVKKQPLLTSDRVYHRIMHDIISPSDFEIGYEDRFVGIKFMPIEKFRNTGDETSEIPFHRVQFYRYKGKVVWDRANRIDELDALYRQAAESQAATSYLKNVPLQRPVRIIPSTAVALRRGTSTESLETAPPTVLKVVASSSSVDRESDASPVGSSIASTASPTSPPRATKSAATTSDGASESSDHPLPKKGLPHIETEVFDEAQVKLATYNVLFDLFESDKIYTDQRIPLACRELEATNADIIALQEMTGPILKAFRANSPLLCARYFWTDLPDDVRTAQVVLSKQPITEAVSSKMSAQKRCIFVATSLRDQPCVVAAVHLLSDHGGEASVGRRLEELRTISEALRPHPFAIMLGDFNFGDNNPTETTFVQSLPFQDAFLTLKSVPFGNDVDKYQSEISATGEYYTFDQIANPVAKITSKPDSIPRRLDRIYFRGPLRLTNYQLFGKSFKTIRVQPDNRTFNLFPSDHFGVLGTFKLTDDLPKDDSAGVELTVTAASPWSSVPAAVSPAGADAYESSTAMAQRLRTILNKSHGTALVIVLPEDIHPAIDAIREQHDKAYPRWMPHITLFFPFVGPSHFPEAIQIIEKALSEASFKPFSVALNRFSHFSQKKPVVFLEPFTAEDQPIHQLHALLQPLFPKCGRQADETTEDGGNTNAEGATGSASYHPHATVGQCEARILQHFKDTMQSRWKPVQFQVTGIHLIAKLNEDDRYRVYHTFPFPGGALPATGAVPSRSPRLGTPQATISPAVAPAGSPSSAFSGADPTAEDLPPLILEDPKYGRRALPQYVPQDPLERWMCKVNIRDLARANPTHISQKGGMYHVPNTLIDTYLQRWWESVQLASEVNFFLEEVRGSTFRLYLDLDVKRTVAEPWSGAPAEDLIRQILKFTERLFSYSRFLEAQRQKTATAPAGTSTDLVFDVITAEKMFQLMSAEEKDLPVPPPQVCDVTCLVTQCHTPAQDGNVESVVFKSGYRLYFQRVFVTEKTYCRYLRLLSAYLKHCVPLPEQLPPQFGWDDVCDSHAADWDRARLYGTVKRRNQYKDVARIYSLYKVFVSNGLVPESGQAARDAEETQATQYFGQYPLCLLYGQVVRLWAGPPMDSRIQYCNNVFMAERLFQLREGEEK